MKYLIIVICYAGPRGHYIPVNTA